ncbi:hypothetical protein FH609_026090 [Streptomyces sp. 3MP-14]|uniref:DNA primase/polymerase bifunctional N-terminal domain-containing protein n=1 Tax=Streptomyces mimosae TaxID=2586635 RepID=A0A5N6A1R3_9ACTN|nr:MULTISPECIES: hypothetical protein [Streptomyces]KAB8161610.1 hypothetical protein FH607_024860 [Streptomyces mimosae]KAB8173453.1 hypothetical protein FH609_026090 [Streptomyces sp. 3MP-14]
MSGETRRSALEWLASAAPRPAVCRWEWERSPEGVALLPAGRRWDVLILPGVLGVATLDVLARVIDRPGPVLADRGQRRVGFFVPPGTAGRWLGTGVRAAGHGSWIVVPHPDRSVPAGRWLVRPDGSGTLNDPAVLELAMHEAAALVADATTRTGRASGEGGGEAADER